ncbi:MAG: hypothetical protein IKQ43_11140 [Treponema sp.]|nr:hypothetical protein [Treponema sp.]MBR6154977.1 hypothetical protein [Treponema sp.]
MPKEFSLPEGEMCIQRIGNTIIIRK